MDTPTISRSGRVVKKSTKVKEMEEFNTSGLEMHATKSKKKLDSRDNFEEFGDKRIQPNKIPKISLNVPATASYSGQSSKKRITKNMLAVSKIASHGKHITAKVQHKEPVLIELSPETSKDCDDSSSELNESTSSSSLMSSECLFNMKHKEYLTSMISRPLQKLPFSPEIGIVEQSMQRFNSPLTFVDQNPTIAMYDSEEESSIDSPTTKSKERKGSAAKRKPVKKPAAKLVLKKKLLPAKCGKAAIRRKFNQTNKGRKITAYILWCRKNRKRVISQKPVMFPSIRERLVKMWKALSQKEKMMWKKKARKLSQKGAQVIRTGRQTNTEVIVLSSSDSSLQLSSPEAVNCIGTSPIDVAAHLKLLGESMTTIGQRLTECEGQVSISRMFSVLLDSTLCALGPLLCLTSQTEELNGCPQPTLDSIMDNIAYFMPGL